MGDWRRYRFWVPAADDRSPDDPHYRAPCKSMCMGASGGVQLRVADPYMLVVFKLDAGGPNAALDILELFSANDLDLVELERVCASLRLNRLLARVLAQRE